MIKSLEEDVIEAKKSDNKSKEKLEEQIKKISAQADDILNKNTQLNTKYEEVKEKYEKEILKKKSETPKDKKLVPFEGLKLIHLDLKGSPPKFDYLIEFMETSKEFGATGLLVEYEDMFPWSGDLKVLARKEAYTKEQLKKFLEKASELKLEVMPLIQTFGHLEFVLKHDEFKDLRAKKDVSTSICPLDKKSGPLVKKMIDQMIELHPNLKWLHMGGDEVWDIKSCDACHNNYTDQQLYHTHMLPLMKHIKSKGNNLTPVIWDDMMREWDVEGMKVMAEHVVPMVWGYVANLSTYPSYPKDMWDKYLQAFPNIFFASSFKGALKPWSNYVPIQQHLENHVSWLTIFNRYKNTSKKVQGIALTGWSRFDHFGPLCELLPAGVPSMALCLAILNHGGYDDTLLWKVSQALGLERDFVTKMKYYRKYKPDNGTFKRHEIHTMIGELEQAYRWKDYAEVRLAGWARPYNIKHKEFSFFQLNDTRRGLEESLLGLTKIQQNGKKLLSDIFNEDTVEEWMEEKVDVVLTDVKEKLSKVKSRITSSFPN